MGQPMAGNRVGFTHDTLQKLYCDEGKTSQEIANMYGCTAVSVLYNLRKFGITIRKGGNTKGKAITRRFNIGSKDLRDLYEDKRLSADAIGERFGCSNATIVKRLKEHGIRVRYPNETKKGATSHLKKKLDHELIKNMYEKEGATQSGIAKHFGVSQHVIKTHLEECGARIKTLTEVYKGKRDGSLNPNWKPSITQDEREHRRDTSKHAKWRDEVFANDKYACRCCGDATGGNLNAHHLESHNSNKKMRWEVSNGTTLCDTCHRSFHRQYGYGNNTAAQFSEFTRIKAAA